MQFFPILYVDGSPWQIPMCDGASIVLGNALLSEESAERRNLLLDLLARDPASMLWALCCAAQHDEFPTTIEAASSWLALHLPDLLQRQHSSDSEKAAYSPERLVKLKKFANESIAIAKRSEELASEDKQSAYLLGLVHHAHVWISCLKDDEDNAEQSSSLECLPDWLSSAVKAISAGVNSQSESPVSSVICAIAEDRSSIGNKSDDQKNLDSRASSSSHRDSIWDVSLTGDAPNVSMMAEKLHRLSRLEDDFQEQLLQEKLASLREFTYGASHEINNPLANISSRAQLMLRDEKDKERRKKLSMIHSHSIRAHEMLTSIALFAKAPKLELDQLDVIDLIDICIDELAPVAHERAIRFFRSEGEASLPIVADEVQLMVAIKALCENALEAVGSGGSVEISARRSISSPTGATDSNMIEIAVRDDGRGMDPREKRHLFDPFFSGREAGRGLGFGLSKCWQIVTEHGGKVTVESEPGEGACLTIHLPRETDLKRVKKMDSTISK